MIEKGVLFLLPAYFIWGLSPIFWKNLAHVSSFELLLHRSVWSFLFLTLIVICQKRGDEIYAIFKNRRTFLNLAGTTFILAFNWYLFIWAVNHDRVLQTSLGYYINPLLLVLLGMLFLKERLRKPQAVALVIAGTGVLYYTVFLGEFPWIALGIAFSFGFYGLIHKTTHVASLPGLCIETLILSVPAVSYLFFLYMNGGGAAFNVDLQTDVMLPGTCLVTALPLLLFTVGARLSTLITVGFMQYIAPSCTFLLAVFVYNEPFSVQRLVTFILIWTALAIYTADSIYFYQRRFSISGNFRIKKRVTTGTKAVKKRMFPRP